MDIESFGAFVQTFRRNWRLDIPTFCRLVQISPSKYTRLVRGEASVSTAVAKRIFSVMAIEQDEMVDLLDQQEDNVVAIGQQVVTHLPLRPGQTVDQQWLEHEQLAFKQAYQLTHNQGYDLLGQLVTVFSVANDEATHRVALRRLVQTLAKLKAWTSFEVGLIVPLLPRLTFTTIAGLLTHFLTPAEPSQGETTSVLMAARTEKNFINLAEGFLCAALETGVATNVNAAVSWITAQPVPLFGIEPRVMKKAARIVQTRDQQSADFAASVHEFDAVLARWGVAPTDNIAQAVQHCFAACETPSSDLSRQAVKLPQYQTAAPCPSTLKAFRQAKRLAITTLAADIGVSYATYHRLEEGDDAVGFDVLLRAMAYLRVGFGELRFFADVKTQTALQQLALRVQKILAGGETADSLQQMAADFTTVYQRSEIPAYHILSEMTLITMYAMKGETAAYEARAQKLMTQCMTYPAWGHFILDAATGCLSVLPYQRTKLILQRYLRRGQWTKPNALMRDLSLVPTLIDSALRDNAAANMRDLADYLQSIFTGARGMDLLAMQQFMNAMARGVAGDTANFVAESDQILANYDYIWSSPQNAWRNAFSELQSQISHFIANK